MCANRGRFNTYIAEPICERYNGQYGFSLNECISTCVHILLCTDSWRLQSCHGILGKKVCFEGYAIPPLLHCMGKKFPDRTDLHSMDGVYCLNLVHMIITISVNQLLVCINSNNYKWRKNLSLGKEHSLETANTKFEHHVLPLLHSCHIQ